MIPKESYHYFIFMVKMVSSIACIFLARIWSTKSEESQETLDEQQEKPETSDASILSAERIQAVISKDRVISFKKAFAKLSLSMFLVSMFYIRFDYFTSRLLYSVSAYDATKRLIYTLFCLLYISAHFHVVFVAPFSSLRKTILGD